MANRRSFLRAVLTAPIAAAALPKFQTAAWAGEPQAGMPRGPKIPYRLKVAAKQIAPFGRDTTALLANGTWPGTELRFSKGEDFGVLVENAMDRPTTLHWHGLILPNLEDGVPDVTQAPIEAGKTLLYGFRLRQTGTYWYHSHVGLQLQQGLSGPLIIEDPDEPYGYDEDLVVYLSDVVNAAPEQVMQKLLSDTLDVSVTDPFRNPDGSAFATDVPYDGFLMNGGSDQTPWIKAVKPGSRVRLRLINASGSTYFRVAIDGLTMKVISADGEPIVPVEVENLVMATAQRYDVLVTVPSGSSHTIHAAGLGLDLQALGVLHSSDSQPVVNRKRPAFGGPGLAVETLTSPYETSFAKAPDKVFEVKLSGNMQRYLWQMNGVSWPEAFATFKGITIEQSFYDVSLGDVVRFDLVNETPMVHPMHLHGHVFRVLQEGRDPATAPVRDTVSVPPRGKVSIEFLADNPGKWFWHCHNVWHLAAGMAQGVRYVL